MDAEFQICFTLQEQQCSATMPSVPSILHPADEPCRHWATLISESLAEKVFQFSCLGLLGPQQNLVSESATGLQRVAKVRNLEADICPGVQTIHNLQ